MTVKTCGCGRTYTLAEFRNLPSKGSIMLPSDSGHLERAEMRDCTCKSTIAIWTDAFRMPIPDPE
jgi:hypothetical protein